MNLNIYSIYDTVAQVFNKPFVDINDNSARRTFAQSLKEVPHKTDYVLYSLGSYTDHDGVIVPATPTRIYSGFDVQSLDSGNLPASLTPQA